MFENDRQRFYARTVIIGGLAIPLGWMLSRSYTPGSLIWDGLRGFGQIVAPTGAVPIEFVSSLLLGIYVGLLGLFVADERKRVQGVILIVGTVVGLVVLTANGILLPNISVADPFNWGGFIAGIVAGTLAGLSALRDILSSDDLSKVDRSFPIASWMLFGYIALILSGGLIQTLLRGTARPLIDVPATVATIYLLVGFVRYTSQADVAAIGPKKSGKSLLLLGLYLSYRDRGLARSAGGYMEDLISQADSITPGEDFPIVNTYDLEKLWFYLSKGGLFPKRIKVTATDHTGELLTRLSEDHEDSFGISDRIELWRRRYRRYNPMITITPGGEGAYRIFEHQVRTADVVLLLVDVARLQQGKLEKISSQKVVGTRAQSNGATVHVVATKCDLLIDDFTDASENPMRYLEDEFKNHVNNRLRDEYASVEELCEAVDADRIFPVYYETKVQNGARIPDLDDGRSLQYQGMDNLGDALLDGLD